MTTVLLFHHAQGQTTGFLAFADELREAGHTVHAPDLYDGRTFDDLDGGIGLREEVGFGESFAVGRRRPRSCRPSRLCGLLPWCHACTIVGTDAPGRRGDPLFRGVPRVRVRGPVAEGLPVRST